MKSEIYSLKLDGIIRRLRVTEEEQLVIFDWIRSIIKPHSNDRKIIRGVSNGEEIAFDAKGQVVP